jgi:imidazole glycerol phosphate synthase glutamine amidotransferase subunit
MQGSSVVVVRTGTANLASVLAGLRRAGSEPVLTEDPAVVDQAQRLVLPGVGSFGAAMARLGEHGLVDVLRARLRAGRPVLAVCVGLQLLCTSSEESPGVAGLGIVDRCASRFSGEVRVPQLGWNEVSPSSGCRLLNPGGHAYFANSFRLLDAPEGWEPAYAEHGDRFVAAFERGAQLACQFHPELSGPWGAELLKRWLDDAARA